jgi:hypothetical protein
MQPNQSYSMLILTIEPKAYFSMRQHSFFLKISLPNLLYIFVLVQTINIISDPISIHYSLFIHVTAQSSVLSPVECNYYK